MINRDRSKYLQAIAEHQSISKAAEALYMSQPSLSRFPKEFGEKSLASNYLNVQYRCIPLKLGKNILSM